MHRGSMTRANFFLFSVVTVFLEGGVWAKSTFEACENVIALF